MHSIIFRSDLNSLENIYNYVLHVHPQHCSLLSLEWNDGDLWLQCFADDYLARKLYAKIEEFGFGLKSVPDAIYMYVDDQKPMDLSKFDAKYHTFSMRRFRALIKIDGMQDAYLQPVYPYGFQFYGLVEDEERELRAALAKDAILHADSYVTDTFRPFTDKYGVIHAERLVTNVETISRRRDNMWVRVGPGRRNIEDYRADVADQLALQKRRSI